MKTLTLIIDGKRHTVNKDVTTVGRNSRLCDIKISDNLIVSREHFSITKDKDGTFLVLDNNSTNGTRVGDTRLIGDMQLALKNGDVITIAATIEEEEIEVKILVEIESEGENEGELADENTSTDDQIDIDTAESENPQP